MQNHQAMRRGFTLLELLLVMMVIAILALIVIPRVANATHKAKDTQLRVNLQSIRKAVAQFNADTGYYPYDLAQITVNGPANGYTPVSGDVKGADRVGDDEVQPINVGKSYRGPYLSKPVETLSEYGAGSEAVASLTYDPQTGTVKYAGSGATADGVEYASL